MLVLAVAGYTHWLAARFSPEAGGADASGYMNEARLFLHGHLRGDLRTIPGLPISSTNDLEPISFLSDGSHHIIPMYPIGLPVHLALAWKVLGRTAGSYFVGIGSSLGCLGVCFLVLLEAGCLPAAAGFAVCCLAASPVFLSTSVQTLSDNLATFWCGIAFWAALRSRRGSDVASVASGIAVAIAVLVRPTDLLIVPPIALLLERRRPMLLAAWGGAPFIAALLAYQWIQYGNPLLSGYGDIWQQFSWRNLAPNFLRLGFYCVRQLPVAAAALLWWRFHRGRIDRRILAACAAWFGVLWLFYSFYWFSGHDWGFLRYLEPAFPALLVICCDVFAWVRARAAVCDRRRGPAIAAFAGVLLSIVATATFHVPNGRKHDRKYVEAVQWISHHAPRNAVYVASEFSGTLFYRTPSPVLRYDLVSERSGPRYIADLHRLHRPIIAILDGPEFADERFARRIPGIRKSLASFGTAGAWLIVPN